MGNNSIKKEGLAKRIESAKMVDIKSFLKEIGHTPDRKTTGNYYRYKSPIRSDSNPSFFVDIERNKWHDKGTGGGGDIINLVMAIYNTNTEGALTILGQKEYPKQSPFFIKQDDTKSPININKIQPLQNRALIKYLSEVRKIPLKLASLYVSELHYTAYEGQKEPYYAIAFKNDKGGYELRNGFITKKLPKGFKGSTKPKYFTTIAGADETINVFEGFINFLSALVHFQIDQPTNKTIILNTIVNLKYTEKILKSASKILSFLDNDTGGNKTLIAIRELNQNVINQSVKIYPGYKDFNDFICNTPQP